jgi:glycosyltransferase 2 family protein
MPDRPDDADASTSPGFSWSWQQALIGVAVGAAFLALTMQRAPLDAIAAALRRLDPIWAALALLAYAVDLALRVIRWRLLFAKAAPLPVAAFARALLVGYGLNILLPARLGELARIEYLKLRTETRRSAAVPAILVERAMDAALVLLALVAGLMAAHAAGPELRVLVGLAWLGAAMVAVLISLPLALRRLPQALSRRLPARAQSSVERAHLAFAAMTVPALLAAGAMTIAIYLVEAAALASMMQALSAPPGAGILLALLGAASLSTLLPTAPGFLGSYQLAFALVFELFGRDPALGAAVATAIQAVLFAPLVIVALALALAPRRRAARADGRRE